MSILPVSITSRIVLSAVGLLSCSHLFAVASAESEVSRLIEKALSRSPEIELIEGQAESLRAEELHLSIWEDPEIRLGYGRDTNVSRQLRSSRYPSHEYDATLRLFPQNPWEARAVRKKLRTAGRLAELSKQDVVDELSAEVRALYWEFCYTRAQGQLFEQFVTLRKQQNQGMEALLKSGQATLEQSLPAKMKQIDAVMEHGALKQAEGELLGDLSRLTGVDKGAIRGAAPATIPEDAFELSFESWQAMALKNRLEIEQFDSQIEYTKAELNEIEASDMLWVKHIQGSYLVRNDYGDRDSYGVEIAFSVPLFSTRDGRKEMATATLSSQQRAKFYGIKMIESEVSNLIDAFTSLEAHWSAHASEMMPMADALRASVEQMEQLGSQANQSYWDAKLGLLELELKELHFAWEYHQLCLMAETVLGEAI